MSRVLMLLGIGIGIGVLVAPQKGSETRRNITDLLDDLTDAGRRFAEPLNDLRPAYPIPANNRSPSLAGRQEVAH